MAATTFPVTMEAPRRTLQQSLALYAKEAKYEFYNKLRIPVFAISTIAFPVMFYVLFGIVLGPQNPSNRAEGATYLLATMACFGVMGASLFGFGVSLAIERGQGWLQVKRASPMPIAAYFAAKLANAVLFSLVISLVLLAIAITFGHVHLALGTAVKLMAILVAGSLPFSAMGLAIGYFAKPNSAPAVVNLVYLPMAFFSGLWIPLFMLPSGVRSVAKVLPPFHMSQLALNSVGMGMNPTPAWGHIEALVGFTLLCLGLAYLGYRRDEGQMYG
jgi:ABC-2 type transport system permease protein